MWNYPLASSARHHGADPRHTMLEALALHGRPMGISMDQLQGSIFAALRAQTVARIGSSRPKPKAKAQPARRPALSPRTEVAQAKARLASAQRRMHESATRASVPETVSDALKSLAERNARNGIKVKSRPSEIILLIPPRHS
jgi:hypothetical protein